MTEQTLRPGPTYGEIFRMAWPIIIANAAVPLLGIADTAIIGRNGSVEALGAIALGSLVFNVVYWTFGFLRMGTTGFVAQANGANDEADVRASIARPLLMAVGLGLLIIALQLPIAWISLQVLDASESVSAITRQYIMARIWAAPATLCMFVLNGALIGLGRSRTLLAVQLFLNGLNIVLDVLFAGVLDWGAQGIAIGTAIAEWTAALLTLVIMFRILKSRHTDDEPFWSWVRIRDGHHLARTFKAHADIMIRTLAMLIGFGWFTKQGAQFGDVTLAANHVLLQFISFIAFFLDGYAFATESLVGSASGAGQIDRFKRAVHRSTLLAFVTAVGLAVLLAGVGEYLIHLLTDLSSVREEAGQHLWYPVIYVIIAAWAFQLDGIFIGCTRTRDMRNASVISVLIFLALGYPMIHAHGNHGLWIAFIAYAAARGLSLSLLYPRLKRSIGTEVD